MVSPSGDICVLDVVTVVPQPRGCTLLGGETVRFTIPRTAALAGAPVRVVFSGRAGATAVPLVATDDPFVLTAVCPSVVTGAASGVTSGLLLTDAGQGVASFRFTYAAPPAEVTPRKVSTAGGAVRLSLWELPAAFPSGCAVLYGGSASTNVSVVSPAQSTLEPTLIDAPAPPAAAASVVGIALRCTADPPDGVPVGALLEYTATPAVSSVSVQGGGRCELWRACAVLVTIDNPPSTVQDAGGISVNTSGVTLLPHQATSDTTPRVAIMRINSQQLVILLSISPSASAGNLTCTIAPTTALAGFTIDDLAVAATIEVIGSAPRIRQLTPVEGPATGGTRVEVHLFGFAPISSISDLVITLAGSAVISPQLMYTDSRYAAASFTTPSMPTGQVTLRVQHSSALPSAAEKDFVLMVVGLNGSCLSGCAVPLSGGSSEIVVVGFPSSTTAAALVADVGGASAAVTAAVPSGDGIKVTVTLPAMLQISATVAKLRLRVMLASDSTQAVYNFVSYHRAPRLSSATFNPIGSQILLIFDQATSASGTVACADTVDPVSRLGSGPSCTWTERDTLTISLGAGATLLPGDELGFIGLLLHSANGASSAAERSNATVRRPEYLQAPALRVVGANEIGVCDSAHIMAYVDSPRPLTFSWGSVSHPALDANLSSETSGHLELRGDALQSETTYVITGQGTTFLGAITDIFVHSLTVRSSPSPILAINLPPSPYLRTATTWMNAQATYSACARDSAAALAYTWEVNPGTTYSEADVVLQATGEELQIPSDFLLPSTTYHVRLLGQLASGESSTAGQVFSVSSSPLSAFISGGVRTVSRSDTALILDASASRDPDVCSEDAADCFDPDLAFLWSCTLSDGAPCRLRADRSILTLASANELRLDISAVSLSSTPHVTFTVLVSKSGRIAQTSVALPLNDGPVAKVLVDRKALSAVRVVYKGTTDVTNGTLEWSISGPGLANGTELLADESFSPTGPIGPFLVINLKSDTARSSLKPGSRYSVSLRVESPKRGPGVTATELRIVLPPSGGSCSRSPATGEAFSTEFAQTCTAWASEVLPLEYSFGITMDQSFSAATAAWTPPSYADSFSFVLADGSYLVAVRIIDAVGGQQLSQEAPITVWRCSPLRHPWLCLESILAMTRAGT